MARLRFIQGAITGKLGELVGSRWKGITYIKTFTKPSNPRTEGQISIRKVFKFLSLFASALFSKGLLGFVPPARRMTERNSVFKANKQMLTDKTFVPSSLQVAVANMGVFVDQLSATFSVSSLSFSLAAMVGLAPDTIQTGMKLNCLLYDHAKGLALASISRNITIPNGSMYTFNSTPSAPDNFNTATGSQLADCRLYLFVSALNDKQKKFISNTYSVPVTL
jgi:hypothetical protein